MSTALQEEPIAHTNDRSAQRLRTSMAAMRLSFAWFGVRKSLSNEQKAKAADAFDAEGQFLSASKKLLDTRDPTFRAVTSIRHRATAYFHGVSLPFPEPAIRLVRQGDLESIDRQMARFKDELTEAVSGLDERFDELKAAARQRLGRLYSSADYPTSLAGLFDVQWEFPSVEPPDYLRQLSPDLYQQECERVQARFDEAIQLAEQAFAEELSKLVSHLLERLSGSDDGKPKIFRDSAVENLHAFFERFRTLNVRSNAQLDELVVQCQQVVRGVEPQALRDSHALRQTVSRQLAAVESVVDGLLIERPRRRILRSAK